MEGSLWKYKSSLTGSTWKKHWVVCDGQTLSQYHSRTKPAANERAKYVLTLANCSVEDSDLRKLCFKVTEAAKSLTLILAVDDFDTYEKWLKLLVRRGRSSTVDESIAASMVDNNADVEQSEASYEEKSARDDSVPPVDPILQFFRNHDRVENHANPCIDITRLPELLKNLDPTINTDIIVRLICRDFNTGPAGVLAHADFLTWWEGNTVLRSPSVRRPIRDESPRAIESNTIVGVNCPEAVHLLGFFNGGNPLERNAQRTAFLSHLRLPTDESLLDNLQAPEIDEVSDWNEAYQGTAERVAELSAQLLLVQAGAEEEQGPEEDEATEVQMDESVKEASVVTHSVQGSRRSEQHPDDDVSVISEHTHSTHSTHSTQRTEQRSSPQSQSRSSVAHSRAGSIPALSVSRNSVPYSSAVSRDGYIAPSVRGSIASHAQLPSVPPGVLAQPQPQSSPRGSVAGSVPPLPAGSPPHSPEQGSVRSVRSSASHSVSPSVRSRHTLPPVPEGSYRSDDANSVRSGTVGGDGDNGGESPDQPPRPQTEREQWQDVLEAAVGLAAVKGAFYRTAIDGVRCIIDEYGLPDEMKTATKLSADLVDTEGFQALNENANSTALEVYALSGMLFSIAACPASTADAPPHASAVKGDRPPSPGPEVTGGAGALSVSSLERFALVSASDEVQHKIAGNEVRNTGLLQATIDALYAQGQLSQRIAAACPPSSSASEKLTTAPGSPSLFGSSMGLLTTLPDTESMDESYNSRMPPPLPPDSASLPTYQAPVKPTTLLTTVVDYAGFRVTVLCPTLIDETTTLVHGASAVPASPAATHTVHVRAAPEVPLVLSNLAAHLNITPYQRPRKVTHQRLCDTETNSELPTRNLSVLSADLQVHAAADGRTYILNLKNILPNALPRPHSYDVQTRQLRPEYVKSVEVPLRTDILQQSVALSLGAASSASADPAMERLVIQEAGPNIAACRQLFSTVLPSVAVALDSFAAIPVDSYGLTQFLHACGVNMRHLGALYWLCSAPSVKQVLLSEALARCCKSILNAQLRQHARRTKGGVLRAQHRGRSVQNDYKEYVGNAMLGQKAMVLELFNLVLGWGPNTDQFWSATLLDALNQKFGISATRAQLQPHLHMSQLFLAMQYHTGTRFQDLPVYNLNVTTVMNPFNTQQIEEYFIPSAKVQLSVPGEVGQLSALGDVLTMHGFYREAACALKLRRALQGALFAEQDPLSTQRVKTAPPVHQMAMGHTTYQLALAQYLSGQVHAAHRTLRKYMSHAARYHPVTGRMLTLLMCVAFHTGQAQAAVQYFDAAQEVYTYALGPNHPVIAMHIACLGELYQQAAAYQQARVMKLLSHVSAQKALGERHIITAMIEYRLAAYFVELQDHYTAMPLLENCVDVFSAAIVEGGRFQYEAAVCLYSLASCAAALGDVDRAGQLALRSVEIAGKVDWKKHNCYPMIASSYFLLGDLALQKNHGAAAVGLLEQCWAVFQKVPASFPQRKWAGEVMAALSRRILSLLVAALPMAVRSLFDSVVSEWHREQAAHYAPMSPYKRFTTLDATSPLSALDDDITVSTMAEPDYPQRLAAQAAAWERACAAVFKAMLQTSPGKFFEVLIQGIRERAISGQDELGEDESAMSPSLKGAVQGQISFAAQAAVVSKLVHLQAGEAASYSLFQL